MVSIRWVKRGTDFLSTALEQIDASAPAAVLGEIDRLAAAANALGAQPLWEGYATRAQNPNRMPDQVRTTRAVGAFFVELVVALRPEVIVEFGTAFGVSGMYWLAGLERIQQGHLYTFEPNEVWRSIGEKNLAAISRRFTSVLGTFEDTREATLGERTIDLAFIDAIHTSAFVLPQLDMVLSRARPGSIIVLDDINFSEDMMACWRRVCADPRFGAVAELGPRVGIVEVA